jgi:alkylation response protein AidB-like acyl-CoA dehydrogenase
LRIRRVLIPPSAGVFSSYGLLYSEVAYHFTRSRKALLGAVDPAEIGQRRGAARRWPRAVSDTEGPTAETTAALYRAKYMVGEAVTRITRTALTLGGAHGIFKGSRLEQLFRDGALAPLHPPPVDYCLYNIGIFELGLDPTYILPPLKPA